MAQDAAAFVEPLIIAPVQKNAAMTNTAPPVTVTVTLTQDAPMTCLVPPYATANARTSRLQFVKVLIPPSRV